MEGSGRTSSSSKFSSLAVLALGLLLTFVLSAYIYWDVRREEALRFQDENDQVVRNIRNRIDRYNLSLMQVRGLFESFPNHEVTRKEFHDYINSINLTELFPGSQGIGFAPRLTSKEVSALEHKVRGEGYKEFRVWPATTSDSDFFPVTYIEPFDWRNQRAFGFDMYREPIRHRAMMRAWLTGKPSATDRVTLVQETEKDQQPGFLIYVPVYQPGLPVQTEDDRKKALQGFVYSPFRAKDFFESLFHGRALPLDFEVFDGANPSVENLLFDRNGIFQYGDPSFKPRFSQLTRLEVAGRTWTIYTNTTSAFIPSAVGYSPFLAAIAGLIISLLLFRGHRSSRLYQEQLQLGYDLEQEARKQTESTVSILETLNRTSKHISAELDLKTLVQSVTDTATALSGAQFGAFFYNVVNKSGESYMLYTISGVPREMFSKFPMPRKTEIFGPTFSGAGIVRSDDIRKDPRYGKNDPHHGMPKGHLPVVSYLAVPVISRNGEVIGGLFFGHEKAGIFTEREERIVAGLAAQAAIAIDNARLFQKSQDAIAVRDEFLSICSHELKTPLTTLKLQTQMNRRILEKKGEIPLDRMSTFMTAIDRQADRLSRLVDDMLDVSRIALGKLKIELETFDLSAMVREVAERLIPQVQAAGCEIHLELGKVVQGRWDRFRIDQVVTNLITNAAKYGERKPIRIVVEEIAGEARLIVADQGMGIAPEHHSRIFERFERAVEGNAISGLGLGLYITRQIIEAHGGSIRVESVIGRGATFIVSLPLSSEGNQT